MGAKAQCACPAFRENEPMFRLHFDRSADAIWLFDAKARVFVDCNSADQRIDLEKASPGDLSEPQCRSSYGRKPAGFGSAIRLNPNRAFQAAKKSGKDEFYLIPPRPTSLAPNRQVNLAKVFVGPRYKVQPARYSRFRN